MPAETTGCSMPISSVNGVRITQVHSPAWRTEMGTLGEVPCRDVPGGPTRPAGARGSVVSLEPRERSGDTSSCRLAAADHGRGRDEPRDVCNRASLDAIEYNMHPVVPGRGSGIFLHVQIGKATSSCVSLSRPALVRVLRWLRRDALPQIAIGTTDSLRQARRS